MRPQTALDSSLYWSRKEDTFFKTVWEVGNTFNKTCNLHTPVNYECKILHHIFYLSSNLSMSIIFPITLYNNTDYSNSYINYTKRPCGLRYISLKCYSFTFTICLHRIKLQLVNLQTPVNYERKVCHIYPHIWKNL